MTEHITDGIARRILPPERGSRILYDQTVKGFGLRVTSKGAKSWIQNYRANGRERRLTIGRFPDFSATAARDRAKALKRRIADGADPMAERHAKRNAPTMNELWAQYELEHLPKKRPASQENDRWIMEKRIRPSLGKHKVESVTREELRSLHRRLSDDAPYMANRVLALLSKMFACGVDWGYRTENPVRGIARNPEAGRNRYLRSDELGRLSAALDQHADQQAANVVRLLLLTGARKGEVLSATWDQFDLLKGVWIKPGATTKQKTEHRVPLSAPACKLLVELQRHSNVGSFLFPGKLPGQPRKELKRFWREVCRSAEIEGCRIHDLRHTYASILVSAGESLPIVGALLGHTQPGTTARYAHLFDDPLREANDRVAKFVSASAEARAGQVIELKTANQRRGGM